MELETNVVSSFIFLTNSFIAFYFNYTVYSILFIILFLTSLVFHSNKNDLTFWTDRVIVITVILYGGYIFYIKYPSIHTVKSLLIIATFLTTLLLYHYGYVTNQYCFDTDSAMANLYHALLHVVSSIGHTLIIIA